MKKFLVTLMSIAMLLSIASVTQAEENRTVNKIEMTLDGLESGKPIETEYDYPDYKLVPNDDFLSSRDLEPPKTIIRPHENGYAFMQIAPEDGKGYGMKYIPKHAGYYNVSVILPQIPPYTGYIQLGINHEHVATIHGTRTIRETELQTKEYGAYYFNGIDDYITIYDSRKDSGKTFVSYPIVLKRTYQIDAANDGNMYGTVEKPEYAIIQPINSVNVITWNGSSYSGSVTYTANNLPSGYYDVKVFAPKCNEFVQPIVRIADAGRKLTEASDLFEKGTYGACTKDDTWASLGRFYLTGNNTQVEIVRGYTGNKDRISIASKISFEPVVNEEITGNIRFANGSGNTVNSFNASGDSLSFRTYVYNGYDSAKTYSAIIAAYDTSNNLLDVHYSDTEVAAGEYAEVRTSGLFSVPANTAAVKGFLWDGIHPLIDMQPITPAESSL